MPYPKTHKAKTKDRILQAATELFCRYGFDKVSISQIMKYSNMTHGAFYAHFESKEKLFSATFHDALKRCKTRRLVKGPLSVKHLTALVSHYWSLRELGKQQLPTPDVILFNEIGNDNAEVRKMIQAVYDNLKKIVELRLRALAKLGRLPMPLEPEKIADKSRVILASLVGAVVLARSLQCVEERNRVLDAAQRQILDMLGVAE